MDVLSAAGLASTVGQVGEFAGQVLLKLYRYYIDVKEGPTRAAELREEVGFALSQLNAICSALNSGTITTFNLSEMEAAASRFNSVLEKINKPIQPESLQGFGRLKWPFKKEDNAQLIAEIERCKSGFSLALNIDQSLQIRRIAKDVSNMKNHVDGETESKMLDWLCPFQPKDDQQSIQEMRADETGTWILKHETYTKWMTKPGSLVWVNGQMGSGKTFLTSTIINDLSREILTDSRSAIAYFYCDGNDSRKQDTRYILGSFVRQLLPKWYALSGQENSAVRLIYEKHKDKGLKSKLVLQDLEDSLETMASAFSRVYLVIDGVDEIAERQHILSFFNSHRRSDKFHLLVASRPLPDIEKHLCGTLRLNIEANSVLEDIETYIQWRLYNDQKFKRIKSSLKKTIQDRLIAQCAGMFRWVQCQLDYLNRLRCDADRRKALSNLPPELFQIYRKILEQIAPEDVEIAQRALKWLVCSARPLTLRELATAAVIVPEDGRFDPETSFDDDESLLEILGPLIHVSHPSETVSVAHFSVKEYLTLRKLPSEQDNNPHFIDVTETHGKILDSCLIYLSYTCEQYSAENLPGEDSLIKYAVVHWPFHARFVEFIPAYRDLITSFLHGDAFATEYNRWHMLYAPEIPTLHKVPDEIRTSLYYAAYFGFPDVLQILLKFPEYSNDPHMKGYALVGAALCSQFQIISMLLEEEINVDFFSTDGIPALRIALFCLHDQPQFVRLLCTQESRSTSSVLSGDVWKPVHLTAIYGDVEAAKIELANGADITVRTEVRGFTPLHLAAWYQNTKMLGLLISHIYKTKSEGRDMPISSCHPGLEIADSPHLDPSIFGAWEEGVVIDTLEMYRVLLEFFPDDYILYEFAGDAYLEKKLYQKAFDLYHTGISLNPKNKEIDCIEDLHHCDFCHHCKSSSMSPKVMKGYRHRCTVCPDFDLCEYCYNMMDFHHGTHSFLSIPSPQWVENRFSKLSTDITSGPCLWK